MIALRQALARGLGSADMGSVASACFRRDDAEPVFGERHGLFPGTGEVALVELPHRVIDFVARADRDDGTFADQDVFIRTVRHDHRQAPGRIERHLGDVGKAGIDTMRWARGL